MSKYSFNLFYVLEDQSNLYRTWVLKKIKQ